MRSIEPSHGADHVIDIVASAGVKYIFGIPGAKVDAVFNAIGDKGPELVVCRHEQNAAFMAAAVGRLTGVPGVVLVTSGPGTTNLATGLLTATTEQDPVVALTGAVQLADRLKRTHQSMDAAAFLATVTKWTVESTDPDDVSEAVINAFRAAATEPRGAAAVVLPASVMAAATTKVSAGGTVLPVPRLGPAARAEIDLAANLIRTAESPVLLVGLRAADFEGTSALRGLIGDTELPVVETFQAAGLISHELEDHYLGRVGLFKNQPADLALNESDLVIAVGYDAVEYDPVIWNDDVGRRVIHIDSAPANYDNHYRPCLELRGDIAATIDALRPAISGLKLSDAAAASAAQHRHELDDIDARARTAAAAAGLVDPARLVLLLRDLLDDDATVACDVGSIYIFMARHFRVYEPRHLLFSNGQQTLGVSLPWAIAAALVRPGTQVVSVSGDGGFLFSVQELDTARRLGVSLTHIIMRDNTDYDIVGLAEAFGAKGRRVTGYENFAAALRESLAEDGVSIIDIAVDYSHNTDVATHLDEKPLTAPPDTTLDEHDDYVVYQTSTMSALLAGVYDGEVTVAQLMNHGDFGLGTFNHLDGEMVILEGICYHLRSDGSVTIATSTDKTPFAAVMHFHATHVLDLTETTSRADLTKRIDQLTGGANLPIGIRIDGTFSTLRTRTVGEQQQPYRSLVEAAAQETINTLDNTTGTIVGFRTPQFEEAISVGGYHLHYVDNAREHGGHVLDLVLGAGRVSIAPISELRLALNDTPQYRQADLDLAELAQQERQAEG